MIYKRKRERNANGCYFHFQNVTSVVSETAQAHHIKHPHKLIHSRQHFLQAFLQALDLEYRNGAVM